MRFLPTVSKELSQNSFRYVPTSAASHAIRSSTLPQDFLYLHFNMLINLIREWGSKFSRGLNAPCKVPCLTAPMQDGLNTVFSISQPVNLFSPQAPYIHLLRQSSIYILQILSLNQFTLHSLNLILKRIWCFQIPRLSGQTGLKSGKVYPDIPCPRVCCL